MKLKRPTFEVIFSPTGRVLGPLFLALSIFLPVSGISGLDICWFHRLTDLPCIGCGLTRSVTCMTHGDLFAAATYHPFGPVIWVMLVALTLYSVAPARMKRSIADAAIANDPPIRKAYGLFVMTFVGFGLLRLGFEYLAQNEGILPG